MDGIEKILQEEDKSNQHAKGSRRNESLRDQNLMFDKQGQQDNSYMSGNEYGITGTAKKQKEVMSPSAFEIKLQQDDEESLDGMHVLERTMSAGKEDGGILREPFVNSNLNHVFSGAKFANEEPGSKNSQYINKGKATDLNLIQQNSEMLKEASSPVKISYMISGQKNIKVNADQNINIKELIQNYQYCLFLIQNQDPNSNNQSIFKINYEKRTKNKTEYEQRHQQTKSVEKISDLLAEGRLNNVKGEASYSKLQKPSTGQGSGNDRSSNRQTSVAMQQQMYKTQGENLNIMRAAAANESLAAGLPPLRATGTGQHQRTADNFYKHKVQQSGQGGMVNHALSLANMGQSSVQQPPRFIMSGQRQRSDSLADGYGGYDHREQAFSNYNYAPEGGGGFGVRSVAAASGYAYHNHNHFNLNQGKGVRKTASSMAGNNYPYANHVAPQSEHGGVSQASVSRSVMIRTRGTFPKTIWQKGALFSTKKSRKHISMGQSPNIVSKKSKAGKIGRTKTDDLEFGGYSPPQRRRTANYNNPNESVGDHKIGTLSELNRLTHGSFANIGGMRAQRQKLRQNRQNVSQFHGFSRNDVTSEICYPRHNHPEAKIIDQAVLSHGAEMGDEATPMTGHPTQENGATLDQNQLNNFFKQIEAFSPRNYELESNASRVLEPNPKPIQERGFLPPIAGAPSQQLLPATEHYISKFQRNQDAILQNRVGEVVYLNIYNVTGLNSLLEFVGFGLYHTSVGLYDLEFSYGGHELAQAGTVVVDKGNSAGLEIKETIPVGVTYYTADEVNDIVDYFGEYWHGCDYDPFSKNCNDFTEQLIKHICDKELYYVPTYVNRFTKLGSILRMWFKPLQELVGDIVNYEESESSSSESDKAAPAAPIVNHSRDRLSQDIMMPPVCGNPSRNQSSAEIINQGSSTGIKNETKEEIKTPLPLLSQQADVISALSGQSPKPNSGLQTVNQNVETLANKGQTRSYANVADYGSTSNLGRRRAPKVGVEKINQNQKSPRSVRESKAKSAFGGFQMVKKHEDDHLHLESLSNGDLSRQEGSINRSFTHIVSREASQSAAAQQRHRRGVTSENGWQEPNQFRARLDNEFTDTLMEAEEFKIKGDNFYINKKYEQAYKVYEIARDLIQDYYLDNGYDPLGEQGPDSKKYFDNDIRVKELKLQVIIALVESASQLGWFEDAIVYAQEGIATNSAIPRLHHLLAKALVGLGDLLLDYKNEKQRDYRLENLELANQSLQKALELSPNDLEIQEDLQVVQSTIQGAMADKDEQEQ